MAVWCATGQACKVAHLGEWNVPMITAGAQVVAWRESMAEMVCCGAVVRLLTARMGGWKGLRRRQGCRGGGTNNGGGGDDTSEGGHGVGLQGRARMAGWEGVAVQAVALATTW